MRWLVAALATISCATAFAEAFVYPADAKASALPPEARETLARIRAGGPFPYSRDGAVFGNREGLLPKRSRGYYREYTVKTPGAKNRGARRIVAGRSGEFYYTEDHYNSFRRIIE